jgi:hypothetical protein
MLPPHKTLKPMPKKVATAPRGSPSNKATLIAQEAEEQKARSLKQKARVAPAPLRVLGGKADADASPAGA